MKILVVDNDPMLLMYLARVLEKEGHEVVTARDGLEARDLLEDLVPDLIIVDYIMPNIDGAALCRIVRSMPRLSGCFVTVLSAIAAEEGIDIGSLGVDACIAKGPLDEMREHLIRLVRDPASAAASCVDGQIIGCENVAPRGITGELLEAKRRYEKILEQMVEGILELSAEGRILYANPSAVKFSALDTTDILGVRLVDLFDKKGAGQLERLISGADPAGEDRLIHFNGFQLSIQVVPLFQACRTGSLVIMTDRSEAYRARQELAASEEKYRHVVENLDVGILVAQDSRLVFANRFISEFLGPSVQELLGMADPFVFVHPEDRQRVFEYHMRLQQGKDAPKRYTYRVVARQNRIRSVEVSSVRIQWADRPATLNFFVDVTKQLQAKKALEESEARYRHLLNVAPAGIYEIDFRIPKMTSVNKLLCETSGYSEQELLAMNPMDLLTEKSQKIYLERLQSIAAGGPVADTVEYEAVRRNGERMIIQLSANYKREDGKIIGATCVVHDVTELRKVEEEKRKLEVQLQQAQRLESIGTLAGGIAHDFNNLLMGIQARISLMMMMADASHPFYRHLKMVEQYIDSGAGLTRQILGFARRGKYHIQPFDLNESVRQGADMFGRTKREISIHLELADGLWPVAADRSQIQQVLLNIYVNAWQAMDGAGELFIRTSNAVIREPEASLLSLTPGRYAEVAVTDTGPGVDPAIRDKIFDPFFTTKDLGRGTGLGLASAYGIIQNHGGSIRLESQPGQGATFVIRLPASGLPIQEEDKEDVAGKVVPGTETVLLVDDEEMILVAGGELLQKMGYRVMTASSGPQAIGIYEREWSAIDLVVLDMIMPEMSGGEVFDRFRKINPKGKILLSSGYSIDGEASKIMDRGCDGFIQKPFRMEVFSKKIREVLSASDPSRR